MTLSEIPERRRCCQPRWPGRGAASPPVPSASCESARTGPGARGRHHRRRHADRARPPGAHWPLGILEGEPGRADLALQLSRDLGGMDRVMRHHMYCLVLDRDATLLFVLTRTFPLRRGQCGQRLCVLGPESHERCEGLVQVGRCLPALDGPALLIVRRQDGIDLITHSLHALERTLLRVTEVADDLDDRPAFLPSTRRPGFLLRAVTQQPLQYGGGRGQGLPHVYG